MRKRSYRSGLREGIGRLRKGILMDLKGRILAAVGLGNVNEGLTLGKEAMV